MSPVELSPQSASVTDVEQSEVARVKDTDIKLVAPTISAKAATLDNRIVGLLVFMDDGHCPRFLSGEGVSYPELDERMARGAHHGQTIRAISLASAIVRNLGRPAHCRYHLHSSLL